MLMKEDNVVIEQAIATYGQRLYGLCITLCRSKSDADDLYQDTWFKVMMKLDQYDETQPFEPWLTRICVNTYKDQRRSNIAKKLFDRFATNEEKDEFIESAGTNQPEDYTFVHQAVQQLPQKLRLVIILYYFQQANIKETADLLHISEGTVKSRLHTARTQLKEVLKDEIEF